MALETFIHAVNNPLFVLVDGPLEEGNTLNALVSPDESFFKSVRLTTVTVEALSREDDASAYDDGARFKLVLSASDARSPDSIERELEESYKVRERFGDTHSGMLELADLHEFVSDAHSIAEMSKTMRGQVFEAVVAWE